VQPKLKVGTPGDEYEREAERVAERVTQPKSELRSQNAEGRTPGAADGPVHDFGTIRIHADERAAAAAGALNARAFTVGRDIYFGAGEYAPGTRPGRRLLVHELTHVVQQAAGAAPAVQFRMVVNPARGRLHGDPDDSETKKLDDLEDYLQELLPAVTVDRTGSEHEVDVPDICAGAARTTDRCLCDMEAARNTWELLVDDYAYPHTRGPDDPAEAGERHVSVHSTLNPMETGAWGGGAREGERLNLDAARVLGHELCGHAWLKERAVHPTAGEVREGGELKGRPSHDPTIGVENRIAREMAERRGETGYEERGTYTSEHGGESFMHIEVWGYPLGSANPYELPREMRQRLDLVRDFRRNETDPARPLYMDVIGHADHVGTAAANDRVSLARANNALTYVGQPGRHALVREGRSDTECSAASEENPACRRVEMYLYKYTLSSESHDESGTPSFWTRMQMLRDRLRVRAELGDVMEPASR
jgi:hypothetical protein